MRTCTTKLQKVRACVLDHAAVLFVGTVPTPLLHHWLAGPLPLGGAGAGARPLPCKSYVSPKAPRAPKLASTVTSWARRALYCMRHDPQGASPPYLIQQFAKHNDNIEQEQVNKILADITSEKSLSNVPSTGHKDTRAPIVLALQRSKAN